jgi:hypothetical protein
VIPVPSGSAGLGAGALATLVLRPERIQLSAAPTESPAAIRATIETVIFQGAVMYFALRAADGVEIVCHLDQDELSPGLEPGKAVWMTWDSGASRLLPRGAGRRSVSATDEAHDPLESALDQPLERALRRGAAIPIGGERSRIVGAASPGSGEDNDRKGKP